MCVPFEGRNQAFSHPPILLRLQPRVIQTNQLKEL